MQGTAPRRIRYGHQRELAERDTVAPQAIDHGLLLQPPVPAGEDTLSMPAIVSSSIRHWNIRPGQLPAMPVLRMEGIITDNARPIAAISRKNGQDRVQ